MFFIEGGIRGCKYPVRTAAPLVSRGQFRPSFRLNVLDRCGRVSGNTGINCLYPSRNVSTLERGPFSLEREGLLVLLLLRLPWSICHICCGPPLCQVLRDALLNILFMNIRNRNEYDFGAGLEFSGVLHADAPFRFYEGSSS